MNEHIMILPTGRVLDHTHYAGFWVRFFAACIDMALYTPFYFGFHYVLGPTHQWWAEAAFGAFALITYAFFFASAWQGSPGMHILRFHISDPEGGRIGFWRALAWGVTGTLGWALCFAGVIYLQTKFDLNAINQITFSCKEQNLTQEDCIHEIEDMIGIPYTSFEVMMLGASGLALFLSLIWALSIALPKDKTGFHNLICGTRFVKGRP